MKRVLLAGLVVVAMAAGARGEDTLPEEARAALRKATAYFRSIATNGVRRIYSLDLKERYGEAVYEKARATEIWVQPPGTPTVGQCYLRAWRATGMRIISMRRGRGGRLSGGRGRWAAGTIVDAAHLTPDASSRSVRRGVHVRRQDHAGALEFLIEADGAIDEPWLDEEWVGSGVHA